MRNQVLYLTPLFAIEILDKQGIVINIVFCLPLICVPNLKNSKKKKIFIFSSGDRENI